MREMHHKDMNEGNLNSSTYDHRIFNSALPVCSAVLKRDTGGLVVKWVTIGEFPLLYVFDSFFAFLHSLPSSSPNVVPAYHYELGGPHPTDLKCA
jgi:hypothetical protein